MKTPPDLVRDDDDDEVKEENANDSPPATAAAAAIPMDVTPSSSTSSNNVEGMESDICRKKDPPKKGFNDDPSPPPAEEKSLEEKLVELLSKDPELIRIVERGVASLLISEEDTKPCLREVVTKRVVRNVLSDNVVLCPEPQRTRGGGVAAAVTSKSRLRSSSRSRSRSPATSNVAIATNRATASSFETAPPPPVKTVSFSSISVPHLSTSPPTTPPYHRTSRGSSISPPPPLSPPPSTSSIGSTHSPITSFPPSPMRTHRLRHSSGENTASGDSSISGQNNTTHSVTFAEVDQLPPGPHHVHFSAMNPNPQLVLADDGGSNENENQNPRVSFTMNRSVSWEDDLLSNPQPTSSVTSSSLRASGLSSPGIEPALSPLSSSKSPSHIQFSNTMEVITEAAARLRRSQQELIAEESGGGRRVVHFSAMREVKVVSMEEAASRSLNAREVGRREDEGGVEEEEVKEDEAFSPVELPEPVVHAQDAAVRLREIVLEAERDDGMPLESSFRLLDPSGTGYITPSDFHMGLKRLGQNRKELHGGEEEDDDFSSINDEDCEELVALFDTNKDGLVSLLDFYRFMGRRSPPPSRSGEEEEEEVGDDEEGGDDEETMQVDTEEDVESELKKRSSVTEDEMNTDNSAVEEQKSNSEDGKQSSSSLTATDSIVDTTSGDEEVFNVTIEQFSDLGMDAEKHPSIEIPSPSSSYDFDTKPSATKTFDADEDLNAFKSEFVTNSTESSGFSISEEGNGDLNLAHTISSSRTNEIDSSIEIDYTAIADKEKPKQNTGSEEEENNDLNLARNISGSGTDEIDSSIEMNYTASVEEKERPVLDTDSTISNDDRVPAAAEKDKSKKRPSKNKNEYKINLLDLLTSICQFQSFNDPQRTGLSSPPRQPLELPHHYSSQKFDFEMYAVDESVEARNVDGRRCEERNARTTTTTTTTTKEDSLLDRLLRKAMVAFGVKPWPSEMMLVQEAESRMEQDNNNPLVPTKEEPIASKLAVVEGCQPNGIDSLSPLAERTSFYNVSNTFQNETQHDDDDDVRNKPPNDTTQRNNTTQTSTFDTSGTHTQQQPPLDEPPPLRLPKPSLVISTTTTANYKSAFKSPSATLQTPILSPAIRSTTPCSSVSGSRRVQFANSIVSEIRVRPRTKDEDVNSLFYSESDLDEFEIEVENELLDEEIKGMITISSPTNINGGEQQLPSKSSFFCSSRDDGGCSQMELQNTVTDEIHEIKADIRAMKDGCRLCIGPNSS